MNRPFVPLTLVMVLSAVASFCQPAGATSIRKMNFRELARAADLVFVGRVDAVEEVAQLDGEMAYTFVTFQDLDVIAGHYGDSTITLRFDGGALNSDQRIDVEGMPRFEVGDRVLLFVGANDGSVECPIIGWHQGYFRIEPRPSTREPVILDVDRNVIHTIHGGDFVKTIESEGDSDAQVVVIGANSSEEPEGRVRNVDRPTATVASKRLTLAQLREAVQRVREKHANVIHDAVVESVSPYDLAPRRVLEVAEPPALDHTDPH